MRYFVSTVSWSIRMNTFYFFLNPLVFLKTFSFVYCSVIKKLYASFHNCIHLKHSAAYTYMTSKLQINARNKHLFGSLFSVWNKHGNQGLKNMWQNICSLLTSKCFLVPWKLEKIHYRLNAFFILIFFQILKLYETVQFGYMKEKKIRSYIVTKKQKWLQDL